MSVIEGGVRGARRAPVPEASPSAIELSVVLPCLNEAATLGECIRAAQAAFGALSIDGEVVVADNGSSDGSLEITELFGARIVPVPPWATAPRSRR